jgi:hypothetical protein
VVWRLPRNNIDNGADQLISFRQASYNIDYTCGKEDDCSTVVWRRLFTLLALQEKKSINASEEVNKVIREVTVELPKQTYSGQVNNLLEVSF